MDLTDTSTDTPDGEPPDFTDWDDPEAVLKDGPIRERLLDVITQLREPTKVATIAERVECDTETAREYLEWFTSMGVVREHAGRPVRYERNESYLFWRRVEQLRREYTEEELVAQLQETVEAIDQYRDRFDAASPGDVSLVEASHDTTVEDAWEELSEWQTLTRRAELLDAARQDDHGANRSPGRIDA